MVNSHHFGRVENLNELEPSAVYVFRSAKMNQGPLVLDLGGHKDPTCQLWGCHLVMDPPRFLWSKFIMEKFGSPGHKTGYTLRLTQVISNVAAWKCVPLSFKIQKYTFKERHGPRGRSSLSFVCYQLSSCFIHVSHCFQTFLAFILRPEEFFCLTALRDVPFRTVFGCQTCATKGHV